MERPYASHANLAFAGLVAIWLGMVLITQPAGEFPINDDWAYVASVRTLVETGRLVFPDWSAPNIVAQIAAGALFGSVFGTSYSSLRCFGLLCGLIGVLASFQLLRQVQRSTAIAFLGALALAGNPIYFASSNSFMTDVPFFACCTLALIWLHRALSNPIAPDVLLGTLMLTLAILVRQLAIAIAIAFALAFVVRRNLTWRTLGIALLPLAACTLAHLTLRGWLLSQPALPTLYGNQASMIQQTLALPWYPLVRKLIVDTISCLLYLGLFAGPVLLAWYGSTGLRPRIGRVVLLLAGCAGLWWVMREGPLPPWPVLGNLLAPTGIGPLLQRGGGFPQWNSTTVFLGEFIGVLAVAGLALATILVGHAWPGRRLSPERMNAEPARTRVFLGLSTAIYLAPAVAVSPPFDRYLLLPFLTGLAFVLSLPAMQGPARSHAMGNAIGVLLLGMATLTAMLTHDYLSWNRVRWQALDRLVNQEKIAPSRIDGGFEFNGQYHYASGWSRPGKKGWWVIDNEFIIDYRPIVRYLGASYAVYARYDVPRFISASPAAIYVLRRVEGSEAR